MAEETAIVPAKDKIPAASLAKMDLPPALLEAIIEDPEQLATLHRVQRAIIADVAVKQMLGNPGTTVNQFIAMIEALRKAEESGKVKETGWGGGGPGFAFTILLPGVGESISVDTRPPIEHKAG